MRNLPEIENLIKIISKLPGLGPKSAKRIILKLINNREELMKPITYERGVEDETLSCGTGAVAVAVVLNYSKITNKEEITISMKGGNLKVSFNRVGDNFSNIWLYGAVAEIYKGEINGDIKG